MKGERRGWGIGNRGWGKVARCARVSLQQTRPEGPHVSPSPIPHPPSPPFESGNAVLEFALLYGSVILPLTFMLVFVAEMAWVWHGVVDFTRDGARYAATHCYEADGSAGNVLSYMESNVPRIIDQNQFQSDAVGIAVAYFTRNPDGSLTPFDPSACGGTLCLPDSVSVGVSNYQFTRFSGFFKLPPVTMPPFTTVVPMESAGYQDASGACVP